MLHFDEFLLDLFSDSVFAKLDMLEAFGGHVIRPFDGGGVLIACCDWTFPEKVENFKILEDVGYVLEGFGAVVGCTNFCFGAASGGVQLSFRLPVNGSTEPDDEAGD